MGETERDLKGEPSPVEAVKQAEAPEGEKTPQTSATNETAAAPPETVSTTDATTPAPPAGEKDLQTQLTEAQAKVAEYLDGWQRSRAEFANYRKRVEKERDELYQTATVDALKKILPVIDDFDRAIANLPADKANDEVIKGFNLIHRKLGQLLESAGVKAINPVGEVFDPTYHEAIGRDENTEVASGHITMVLQKGYLHGDKVLRPAMVRVAS